MIVQCEQCRTKFRLDDEKVSERGVKVRCAKCRHVFTVQREENAPETAPPLGAAAAAPPSPVAEDLWAPALETADATVRMAAAPPAEPEVAGFEPEPSPVFDFGDTPLEASPAATDTAAAVDTTFGDISLATSPPPSFGPAASEFDLAQTDAAAGSVDFSDLSFGSEPAATGQETFGDMTMVMAPPQQPAESAAPFPPPEPAIGIENPFDEPTVSSPAMAAELPPPLPPGDTPAPTGTPAAFMFSPAPTPDAAAAAEDSFGLGDLTFENETTAGRPAVVEAPPAPTSPAITFAVPEQPQSEEVPPLAISSRRRQSPLLSSLIAVVTVLVVGALGYLSYHHLSDGPGALKLFEKSRVPAEEGRITIQKTGAFFLEQTTAGELLVITGEAVNQFSKPRASLQVKATLFAGDGSVLTSKTAYAGNQLTREQLLTMPADKIETTMNNQFGDSLVNLEVQPGKAIPFTIVVVNPPKEGRDFAVEAAGSTVAASK